MFVSKKKYEDLLAQIEDKNQSITRQRENIQGNIDLLRSKDAQIFQLQEKVRQLQKKPFKK